MNTEPLVAEVLALAARIDQDEMLAEEVGDLAGRAAILARTASPAQRQQISEAVTTLESSVTRALERMEAAMRDAGQRRSALIAYGSVRSHKRAQNLRTKI